MSTAIRRLVTAGSIAAAALLAVVASNSARWIGTTFPGFLLMQNRVVPSVALPHWARGQARRFFQLEVVAVDGVPTTTAAAIYEQAARRAPGVHVAYTFRHSNGETFTELVPAQVFSASDWVLLFGAYFLTGAAFLAAGAVVMAVKPGGAPSLGLVACGTITGLFAFTAADLYGPYWFFRLHVACEAFLGVGLLHLALVFPVVRAHRHRLRILATLYVASGLFAATYETALFEPRAYTAMHLLASATHGAGALALIVSIAYELLTSGSPLIRRKIGVVAAGALSALVVPAIAMGA